MSVTLKVIDCSRLADIAVSAAGVVDVGAVALQPGVGHGGRQQGRDQGAQSQVARHLGREN